MLASLARDGDSSAPADAALAGAITVQPAEPITAAPPEPASASLATPDARPDPVPEPAHDPAPEPAHDPVPETGATIVDVAPAPAAEPAAPQQHAGRIAAHEFAHDPQHTAQAATEKNAAGAAAGKAPSTDIHAAPLARAEQRHRRPAPHPKAAPEPVDTDVALISAIIRHANKRQEADDAARKP
jgi:hypothetical protein